MADHQRSFEALALPHTDAAYNAGELARFSELVRGERE
jgi:hypothetical protein